MPRNPSTGVYSKPAGTTPSVGQVIDPVPWNALTTDLGNEITNSLPRDGSAPMIAPLKAANGTVSNPAIAFGSNPQTGLYLKGGGLLGFTQNGVDVAFDPLMVYTEKTADYTALVSDKGAFFRYTAAGKTLILDDSADVGKDWYITVMADGVSVNVARSGSDTINGQTMITVPDGYAVKFVCSGTAFYSEDLSARFDFFIDCVPAWMSNTSISFTSGLGFFGGKQVVLPAYTKLLNAQFAAGNNAGMMDTGPIQASKTYFVHSIRNLTTGAADYLASLSLSAPTVPAGWEVLSGGRLGIILTNASSNIVLFTQVGNEVRTDSYSWFTTSADVSGLAIPSNIPIGISVDAWVLVEASMSTTGADIIAVAADAVANGFSAFPQNVRARARTGNDYPDQSIAAGKCRTSASGQIFRYVDTTSSSSVASFFVCGWNDYSCKRLWG